MNITKRSTAISFGMAAILAAIVIPFMPSNSFATEVTEVDDATVGRAIGGTINFPSNGTSSIQKAFGDAVNGDGSKSSVIGIPIAPPIVIPLAASDFIYRGASTIAQPKGYANANYFNYCIKGNYGLLGTAIDQPVALPPFNGDPIIGLAASDISPNLNSAAIARLRSVQVKLRFAFLGNSQGSRVRLALRNVNTNEVKQFGDFRVSGGTCQTFSKNLVKGFVNPGVYRLEVRLVNRPFLVDPSYKRGPFDRAIAVAGFNDTTLTITTKSQSINPAE